MSVQVVTICNRIPDRAREPYYRYDAFIESMARWGERPTILGMGEPWGGLMTKPRRLRQWLRDGGCGEETLIICDTFDIVFTTRAGEVAERYRADWPEQPIVFNAEKGIFPRGELRECFDRIAASDKALSFEFVQPPPWRYLNSGFMIGPPTKILAMLEAMWLDDIADDFKATDDLHGGSGRWINPNDQGWYETIFCTQVVPAVLDYRGSLCQTLSACALEEFDLTGERIRNVATGAEPLVFHFNGSAKNDLLPVFLRKWGME